MDGTAVAAFAGRGPLSSGIRSLVAFYDVTKRFPGVVANDQVSFAIYPGEVHVLLGENGAGKSTLVGMLAGIQQPDEGGIEIEGRPVRIGSPRDALDHGIGTVFQHGVLVPGLTVVENLLLGGAWWRRPRRPALRARFRETCSGLGFHIDPDATAGALSLGEQQQVEIIRALWRGGKVAVLDEPTAMLTPDGIRELGALMRRIASQGIGVVFITHKLHEALSFGDRVTVLRLGRVVGEIAPEGLRAMSRTEAAERIVGMMFGEVAHRSDLASRTNPPTGAPVLQARRLSCADESGREVLHDVNFDVAAGEILGLAGIDGNGQKQLAEVLAGQRRGEGTLLLDGDDITALGASGRHRAGLRYLTDDRLGEGTVSSFPVSLNLLLKQVGEPPFWRGGVQRHGAIAARAEALVRKFDIRTPSVHTPIGRLSGGNIQKALLARELEGTTRAVVYSKPTHGLDVRNIESAQASIRAGADSGIATILISTDLDEILELSDRIGVMVGGRLVGIVANGPGARAAVGAMMVGAGHAA